MEKTVKLIQESNPQWSVVEAVAGSLSSKLKIRYKYKRNVVVKKSKTC